MVLFKKLRESKLQKSFDGFSPSSIHRARDQMKDVHEMRPNIFFLRNERYYVTDTTRQTSLFNFHESFKP